MKTLSKANIYTKKGDRGMTQLADCTPIEKYHPRVEAYGCVDELNSQLGVALCHLSSHHIEILQISRIQNELFVIGSHLACLNEAVREKLPPTHENMILQIENDIDQMNAELPELTQFILPGGSLSASHIHVARAICRRAERRTSELTSELSPRTEVDLFIIRYLNRLSDYLFMLSRWINKTQNFPDVIWKKP